MATTPGWVWAAVGTGLHRIDPITGSVDFTIDLPSIRKANIEVDDGALWIIHGMTLTRVDPETAAVTGTIGLSPWIEGGTRPLGVTPDGVWVAAESRLLRIDKDDMGVAEELPLALTPSGLAVGADSVWALVGQSVLRIDPATLEIVAAVPLPGTVFHPAIGTPLTYGQDTLWISAGGLSRLDPATNEASIIVDDPECCGPIALGFAGEAVIACGLLDKDIVLVDRDTGEVESIFTPSTGVFAIEGDPDGLWAAAPRSGMLYRFDLSTEQQP
ncbi:MAG: hypothetical protein ABFS21_03060 [Actinomycetota bacterium]